MDLAFTTWTTPETDREDPGFYRPSALTLESALAANAAVPLEQLVDFVKTPFKGVPGDTISYIDIASVNPRLNLITPSPVIADEAPSRARFVVTPGDILVSSVRPERGGVAVVPAHLDGAVASSGFFVLRPNARGSAVADELFLFLTTDHFRVQASRHATASMYPVINEAGLRQILIPLAGLARAEGAAAAVKRAGASLATAVAELEDAQHMLAEHLPPIPRP